MTVFIKGFRHYRNDVYFDEKIDIFNTKNNFMRNYPFS